METPDDDAAGPIACFVAGPENALVATVANRLIEHFSGASDDCPPLPCPIVLSGPSGSGKTHLARGLVELWRATRGGDDSLSADETELIDSDAEAVYLTSADFRRAYAAAIDQHAVGSFRRRLRSKRFIAIDDAHRLADSDHAAAELRHTIDEVGQAGGIVLLTLGGPNDGRVAFDRPLLSRLAAGLSIEIAPPGREARRELLRHAAAAAGCAIADGALETLAENLPPEPPRVLHAAAELRRRGGTRIDVQTANRLLGPNRPRESPPLREILRVVARYHQIPLRVLTSASRKQGVVAARAVAIYLARELTPMSYADIGKMLGGRDHTTVMHNYRRIDRELPKDRALRSAVEDLKRLLASHLGHE